jgi:hypothetical protein
MHVLIDVDVMVTNIAGCGCKNPGTAQAVVAWIRNSVGANYQDFEQCRLWKHGLDTVLAQVIKCVNNAGSGCMDLE